MNAAERAEFEALKAENARLKTTRVRQLKCKIGAKGGVSVSGINARFPVTLYAGQWERLMEFMPQIKEFIDANRDKLATKEVTAA